jgi:hypothetical protein
MEDQSRTPAEKGMFLLGVLQHAERDDRPGAAAAAAKLAKALDPVALAELDSKSPPEAALLGARFEASKNAGFETGHLDSLANDSIRIVMAADFKI